MSRTLVTGAAGFTGRYVVAELAGRGHEVHGLVHSDADGSVAGAEQVHEADLADLEAVVRVVDEVQPTHVVHLAAISFVAHQDVEQMYRSNVVGTRQLLEALSRLSDPPSSILLASSANIYGNAQAGVLDERAAPAPVNDYGVSKLAMEYVAALYGQRLPLIVVRPFNYTGRGQPESFLIPKIVAHAHRRSPCIELGNLQVARDFSDVRTIADAYARLLLEAEAPGSTFNICSGKAVSLGRVLELVQEISGHDMEVRVNPALVRPNEVRELCGSAARLEAIIGPLRTIALEETLRWMLEA
jgi:nucleoside-diphosphate-sugar epimerase